MAATVVCVLGLAVSSAAATDFTWTGAAPVGTASWSNATNWGGTTPTGTVGTLAFPALSSAACLANPRTATCYQSNNDVAGLNVTTITLDDGAPYLITGSGLTLGAGGLIASTTSPGFGPGPSVGVPITLAAPQTWSVDGNNVFQQITVFGSVTGTLNTLAINLNHQGGLNFPSNDVEVGPVTIGGTTSPSGSVNLLNGGKLNATDGNAVSVSGGASLSAHRTGNMTGPLTSAGSSHVTAGDFGSAGQLAVNGAVTFDPTSTLQLTFNHAGTTAGSDYSQLSATGTISLTSAHLSLFGEIVSGMNGTCVPLNPGDVATLVSATGSLTGAFTGVPDGTVMPVNCASGTGVAPTVRINYTPNSVVATVVTSGSTGGATSSTTLSSSPGSPLTNQTVTLTARVTASSGAPVGNVTFKNGGTPIAGCASTPLTFSAPFYTAICQTSFTAASSPDALTAAFIPAVGSAVPGSTSAVSNVTVGQDATATALTISGSAPAIGANVTYTATVTPANTGPAAPSGSVQFLDGGVAIGSCSSQPLSAGSGSSTATCSLSYPAAALHSITVAYPGDANFTGSSSAPAQTVTVQAATVTSPGGGGTGAGGGSSGGGGSGSGGGSSAVGAASAGTASVSGTTASVPVTCTGPAGTTCPTTVSMTVTETFKNHQVVSLSNAKAKKRRKTQKIVAIVGRTSVVLGAGQSQVVRVSLSSAGKRLLSKHGKLPVSLVVSQSVGRASKVLSSQRLTFTSKGKHNAKGKTK